MRNSKWLAGLLIFSSGCASMNNTEMGAVNGGVLGAALGAVVGAVATRNPMGLVYGAAAGGALGAGVGAANGAAIDNAQQRHVQAIDDANYRAYAAACNPPFTLEQIRDMSQRHYGDQFIINQINATNSTYYLSADQIIWLKDQGVSDYVISYMQSRGPQVVQPGGVVVAPAYAPGPPVAVGVGVGVGFRR